jgi:hypothetical protein
MTSTPFPLRGTQKKHRQYGILENSEYCSASSAWARLIGGNLIDEVETVRIISGESPGLITALISKHTKLIGNDQAKKLAVI